MRWFPAVPVLGLAFTLALPARSGTLQGTVLDHNHAFAEMGFWVAAGDVDGDGYADLVAGAPYYEPVAFGGYLGQAVLFPGGPSGLDPYPSWSFDGTQPDEEFGRLVAVPGDVNGDGYADVLVSAPRHDSTVADSGKVWLFLGSANGLGSNPAWTMDGDTAGGMLAAVAGAGDVNGDGFDDVVLGAPNRGGGTVFLFLGSATGLRHTPALTLEEAQPGASFGFSVAAAGDVDGDGHADVVVGAFSFQGAAGQNCGKVYLFKGTDSGLADTPAWTVEGDTAGGLLGESVAGVGDVNKDGFADVAVSAPMAGSTGEVRVYHGSATGLTASPAFKRHGSSASGWFGTQVAPAGDFNADGYADMVVGAYAHEATLTDEGQVFIFLGSPSGLGAFPAWTGSGGLEGAQLGMSVTAGDFNGDGITDVAAGAPFWFNDEMEVQEGAALEYLGCSDSNRDGVCGGSASDRDHDGDPDLTDCAPDNPAIHHGAEDTPGDAVDQDCSGAPAALCYVDSDHDGYPGTPLVLTSGCTGPNVGIASSDCNDADPAVHTGCTGTPDAGRADAATSPGDAAVADAAVPDSGSPVTMDSGTTAPADGSVPGTEDAATPAGDDGGGGSADGSVSPGPDGSVTGVDGGTRDGGGPAVGADASVTGTGTGDDGDSKDAGCACGPASGAAASPLTLLAALAVLRARRRR